MKKLLLVLLSLQSATLSLAQGCFNVGTGADGVYYAASNTTLAGGTYNFSSFTIDPGVTVTVTGNAPLVVYCTGTVLIDGVLSANGSNGSDGITYTSAGIGGLGVAGGANGGDGSFSASTGPIDAFDGGYTGGANTKGLGWSGGGGAGYEANGTSTGGVGGFGGIAYGTSDLAVLEAGSGGGGGSGGNNCGAGGGGAGGGIIVIQANSIIIGASGAISANGGNGGSDGTGNCGGGGGGSGGTIWLAAPTVTHDGAIAAIGGIGGISTLIGSPYYGVGGNGADGRVRIDVNGAVGGSGVVSPAVGFGSSIVVLASTQDVTICYGDSYVINGNEYTSDGTYVDVLASVVNGCDSTVTTNLFVEAPINVAVSINAGLLTADESGMQYQWIDCDNGNAEIAGAVNQTYFPASNGNYAVIVYDGSCQDTSACTAYDLIGLKEKSLSNFSIYPNPSHGYIALSLPSGGNIDVQLEDVTGRTITVFKGINSTKYALDLSKEANGIYFVSCIQYDKKETIRVIKY